MRGHCVATAHRRSDRVHGPDVEGAEEFDVRLSSAAGDRLWPGRVDVEENVDVEPITENL